MLIRREGDELVVVRQTDHMAQVARIAERWGNDRFPPPEHREETIRAAALHDNGWRDWEDRPTLVHETGRPRNLGEIGRPVHAAFYRAGVERAAAIDPYTGLLVAMHALALYAGIEGWDLVGMAPPTRPDLDDVSRAFIADQALLIHRLRGQLATSPRYGPSVQPERLWPAYLRLRAWDRLSLYLVFDGMGEGSLDRVPMNQEENGSVEVSRATTIALRQTGPRRATAEPWPFDGPEVGFPVVEARVPDRRYASGEEFLHTLARARHEVVEYTMHA